MNTKEVWEKIKFFREKQGIKKEAMAMELGMSLTSYSEHERGEHELDLDLIERVAALLHVDKWVLLQPGPIMLIVQGNHHNTNVGYTHVEQQHTIPKEAFDRLLTAHEKLIAIMDRAFSKPN